jgi:hypothetical protein
MALYGPLNMFCMAYCLQAMCSQHEYKDKQKIKRQGFCGKLACQVYSARNVNFTLEACIEIYVFC